MVFASCTRSHPDAHFRIKPIVSGALDGSASVEGGVCDNIRNTNCWWLGSRALDMHLGLIEELSDGDCASCAVGALCQFEYARCSDGVDHRTEELVVEVLRECSVAFLHVVVSVLVIAPPSAKL